MRGIWGIDPGWGITAVRLAVGVIVLVAGWAKLMVGMDEVTASFAQMGIPAPGVTGLFVMLVEIVGGALLILGIATRWVALVFAIEFLVTTLYVKIPVGLAGARLDIMLLAGNILLFLAGPGRAAVDALWLEKPATHGARRTA
ncbi:MAG TPA: DoxX family protein [Methylomirabilota bacterium]|nr:DoxX family protein [Methylomirabilota bacterium]